MTLTGPYEICNSITVPFVYRVFFSDDVLHVDNPLLADLLTSSAVGSPARAVAFVDQGLHDANPDVVRLTRRYFDQRHDRLTLVAPPQIVPGGEDAKRDDRVLTQCVRVLHDTKLDRHSYVIAIGGGAVLDAVGFAASIVHRGLRLLRIPTTVLAQNDAGIGVKNGIDYFGKKNFLGSFYPPHAVLNDFSLLRTLPAPAWRDGAAEAVKVALIRDAAFFSWIEAHAEALAGGDPDTMRPLIRRCAELHLTHITTAGDPFERGSSRPLDFGHWSAHRLEQLSGFRIGHGHAVAAGIAIDTLYSRTVGLLDAASAQRIITCLQKLGFCLSIAGQAGLHDEHDIDSLLDGIAEFQEHLGGGLCLTMLQGIGHPVDVNEVDKAIMRQCSMRVLFGDDPSYSALTSETRSVRTPNRGIDRMTSLGPPA